MLAIHLVRLLKTLAGVGVLTISLTGVLVAEDFVNAQLPWHQPVLDSQGRILAWYQPDKGQGYDKVLKLGWDFIEHKVPNDTRHKTGLKIYLINSVFDAQTLQGFNWQGNPASLFGQFVDSLVGWYPYSGDEESIAVVRSMLDYQLAHGTTPADWDWPNVPFATNCDDEPDYGRCIQNMPREFYGGIETDKLGELGIGYVLFCEMTGDQKYLDAGIHCANALAKHVRPGDEDHTPWPFRVDARTGQVLGREEYGGMIVAPVRLLDELVRLKAGDTAAFQKARDMAWSWIMHYPLTRRGPAWDKWSGYFEDVPQNTENLNQASPTLTAYYILTREDPGAVDPRWQEHVGHVLDWVRSYLGLGPFFGAWAINEQRSPGMLHAGEEACCSRAGLGSDTSRWGAINAMYYEKTGDAQAREDAFRSLNYATYFAASDGKISCCGEGFKGQYWFDDGYADYIRNYMWAMGAVPEFAPLGENHLLRSTSVVQKVSYGPRSIRYLTFDKAATEVLRLNFKPTRVEAGNRPLAQRKDLAEEGYTLRSLPDGDCVLQVRHQDSADVSITGS